jgi:hypothetical protein
MAQSQPQHSELSYLPRGDSFSQATLHNKHLISQTFATFIDKQIHIKQISSIFKECGTITHIMLLQIMNNKIVTILRQT